MYLDYDLIGSPIYLFIQTGVLPSMRLHALSQDTSDEEQSM